MLDLSKDGATGVGTALAGAQVQLTSLNSLGLLDNLLSLSKDQLNVTWVRHVWVDLEVVSRYLLVYCMVRTYATVGTVCAATLLWCLVDLDVLDDEVAGIETLGIGVGLSVLEETEKELGGLDWPTGTGNTKLLSY